MLTTVKQPEKLNTQLAFAENPWVQTEKNLSVWLMSEMNGNPHLARIISEQYQMECGTPSL
jgi:hypothetical protein